MKLISSALGKIIVAFVAVVLTLTCIGAIFVPKVKEFAFNSMLAEKNYMISDENSDLFTLSCSDSDNIYELLVDDSVDIFADITAKTAEGEDLIDLLEEDYAKPVIERKHVFIYKITDNGSAVLSSDIDSSVVGEWAVVYVLNDGLDRATLKVHYMFLN